MPRQWTAGYYALRFAILERDDFTCQYCGATAPSVPLEVDHRIPVAAGGTDDWDNLVTACWPCNRGKGDLLRIRARQDTKARLRRVRQMSATERLYAEVGHGVPRSVDEIARACGKSERWVKDQARGAPDLLLMNGSGGRGHRALLVLVAAGGDSEKVETLETE